jgi:predicted RNA polymerase sigma factor
VADVAPSLKDEQPVRATAEMVARQSYGKLVAFLAARTSDVAGAEDALSDAFASALADWSVNGVPRTPEAWLLTGDPRAAPPSDQSRVRCRDHRVGVSGRAADHGAAPRARQKQDQGGPHSAADSRTRGIA